MASAPWCVASCDSALAAAGGGATAAAAATAAAPWVRGVLALNKLYRCRQVHGCRQRIVGLRLGSQQRIVGLGYVPRAGVDGDGGAVEVAFVGINELPCKGLELAHVPVQRFIVAGVVSPDKPQHWQSMPVTVCQCFALCESNGAHVVAVQQVLLVGSSGAAVE